MRRDPKLALAGAVLAAALLAAYSNHFRNAFHFDDFHAVVNNPAVRDIRNLPRFFSDPRLSSTMPDHYNYRPVVYASLAWDYWRAGSLDPFWFHVSTFICFAALVAMLFLLYGRILAATAPRMAASWTALGAAAWYGLHPANAETVTYISQRAKAWSTGGLVGSLLAFAASPVARRTALYLLPAFVAYLAKPPALIFPALLFAY